MDRLTAWDKGHGYIVKCFEHCGCKDMDTSQCVRCEDYVAPFDRLASFEDLGYTPEELREKMENSIPMLCRVGDVLWTNLKISGDYLRNKDKPYSCKVIFVGLNGIDGFINVQYDKGRQWQFTFSDIGNTIFLTREEAEAAKVKGVLDK